jgi:flagellar M-ring protein FliF
MRRLLVLAAVAGTFFAVLSLARVASTPSMALLYSGLDSAAAGEVIQSLEQMGAVYDVREQAIFVDASRRDMLRMALAAEGKPAATNAGYEILDGLSGFGTTAQMFDAAYWRAKEGELARTIVSNPQVRSARVHISKTPTRTFGNDTPGAASVVVSTASGGVTASHAKALKFLISSAVPGLTPEQVSVIDADGGLVASGDESADPVLAAGDRAASLKANVERLLEARVGYGKAVVEINLDTVTEREQIVERTLDPDSRVAISTVTEETTSSAQDARGGEVTVAGNLPDGDANGSGGNSSSSDSGTREQVNYEISETQREIVRAPGAIRRLSVAVLIDGLRTVADDGTETWAPRSEEELSALRELVASAVGFDESRGDTLTLRTMEFLPVEPAGTEVSAP